MSDTFVDDFVRLSLGGDEVPIAESYEVSSGVIDSPSAFSMVLGHGGLFRQIAAKYPPRTRFELRIGGVLISSGETDGLGISGGEATTMKISGRDYLARLQKTQILSEQTFAEKTFRDLTLAALKEVGLGDRALFSSNEANRRAITGSSIATEIAPKTEETLTEAGTPDAAPGNVSTRTVYRTIKANIGNTWLEFLLAEYKRSGLFLWAAGDGNFILSQPNGNQDPLYRILRRRGQLVNEVNVVDQPNWEHNTVNRFSECIVVNRSGGGKKGRTKAFARFIDEEMVALLNPDPADRANGGKIREPIVIHDQVSRTEAQAKLLARRRIAESRRSSWKLSYTVAGHTTPALKGGGRVIWQPDTVVEVDDDELGISGPMYIENVKFSRDATRTVTELRLMRCEDLVYAEETDEQFRKKPKLKKEEGVTTVDPPDFIVFWDTGPDGHGAGTAGGVLTTPALSEPNKKGPA